jgi:monoamine oxidase
MARTPLLTSLQVMFRDIGEAEIRGISLQALRRLRLEARRQVPSRRAFLRQSAGLFAGATFGGSLLLSSQTHAANAPRIGIVGGGMAGLNAALTLHDRGVTASLFEASNRVGGRMHTDFTSWQDGQTSEWCGELLDSGHKTMFALAKRFNLVLLDRNKSAAKLAAPQATNWLLGRYYTDAQAEADFLKVHAVLKKQSEAAPFPTKYNAHTPTGIMLDHTSIHQWIEQYVPGGHGAPLGRLLDIAYDVEFGRTTSEQSALNLVYLLADQPDPKDLSLFGQSDERYEIAGGNEKLIHAVAAALPKDTVRTRWRLTRIDQDGREVTLDFATPGGAVTQRFDKVILAIPFSVLRTLDLRGAKFDRRKLTAIHELGYGTNAKLHLEFGRRYWQDRGPWTGSSTGESYAESYQNTWDAALAQKGKCGVLNNFTGSSGARFKPPQAYNTSDSPVVQQYAREFLTKLETVWPGARAHYTGRATLSCPARDPNLLGSYACYLVGQYTGFGGYEGARQDRIHFAGEHTSTDFQGYMEGAAATGAQAAKDALSHS